MATLLLWLGFESGAIDEQHWQALESRALARAQGEATRLRGERLRVLCIRHRAAAPPSLRPLADGSWLLADLDLDVSERSLVARVQDTPAAVIHVDPLAGRLRLLRDRLGQRPLVWARVRDGILVTSGEHILLAHPQVDAAWNPEYFAAYFGATAPPAKASAWRGVHTVAPGECLHLDAHSQRSEHTPLEPDSSVARLPERAASDRFRQLLGAAVGQECRQASRIGISLSSGLDSGSVAALLPGEQRGKAMALTYGSDQLVAVDERAAAAGLARRLGIEHAAFSIDPLAPLAPSGDRPVCPDTPISNPYREIKTELYRRARAYGVDALLTGHFADHLQPAPGAWLGSAWNQRAFRLICQRYTALLRQSGPIAVWRDRSWRQWLGGSRRAGAAPWLRPEWTARLLAARQERLAHHHAWPQPAQAAQALGSYAAIDAAGENYFTAQHGIDVRHPYREVELVRFALSLPAHLSERQGQRKWLVRAALTGCLPDPWRLQPKSTSMQPFFDASLFGSGQKRAQELIDQSRPLWAEFVDPAAVAAAAGAHDGDEFPGLLRWLLVGFSLWSSTRCSAGGTRQP